MLKYVLLLVGFVLLVKGADYFVEGSASIAKKLKVPSIIIGLTIVALGTSAPELAVSITAGFAGNNELAISNVIGSNVFNLLMVVGICAAFVPMAVKPSILKVEFPFVILIEAMLLFFCANGFITGSANVLSRLESAVFVGMFVGFMAYMIISALKARKAGANQEEEEIKARSIPLSILFVIGGAAAIVVGGDLVVDNASLIAVQFGMSQTFIGLTIVAMGTSLPELVTSLVAMKKGENDLAIGNVVGSNIFNILFVLAVSSVLSPIAVINDNIIDAAFLLVISIMTYVFALDKKKISRVEGMVMVASYLAYTAYLIMR